LDAPGKAYTVKHQAPEILERMREGFYAIDAEWRLVYVNRGAEEFWGRKRDELLGRTMFSLFPAFEGSPAHEAHKAAFAGDTPIRIETVSTATGSPVELNLYPDPPGLSVYFHDIGRRVELEQRLRERDEILTLAEMSAGIGIWDSDLRSQTLRGTPQFFRLHGLEPIDEAISFDVTRQLRHPEDRERVVAGFNAAIEGGSDGYEVEYRIVRPDGQVRWIFGRGRVIRDATGKPVRYSGVDIDITERKRQEDQLRLMTHELRHRANNLLAVIQAMARQTARASSDLEDFETRFDGRIRALADSNDLLVRQDWQGVEIGGLVRAQLKPFADTDGERLVLHGPHVELTPKAVQTIGLALHELATNASKYGALSVPTGKVTFGWQLLRTVGDETRLSLHWREVGGPAVTPPGRRGFGRFVIEAMVAQNLDASVTLDFASDGVNWTAVCGAAAIAGS
jgi:PAS domain S-box-containing protein